MNKAKRYTFLKSRTGESVPAFIMPDSDARPLHSLIDPVKEAERLISAHANNDFLIFLGLGGGFAPLIALEKTSSRVVVIDFNKTEIEELTAGKDYSALLENSRFSLLTDYSTEEIKSFIMENFNPALYSGIKTIPLRTRTEKDIEKFDAVTAAIKQAIETVSGDFSVQAHFGFRWFSNIIRNINCMEDQNDDLLLNIKKSGLKKAAITAAGPSLDLQIPSLKNFKSQGGFIISCDTALGSLLQNGIKPDLIVSIDCQHISYYHFAGFNTLDIPLILDMASPPLLCAFSSAPVFFSSGHPLCRYINSVWRDFPLLDTSGGNVTYACLSLAEYLNIEHITLFGADFSYVRSQSYARGTYIYPYFHNRQNRILGMEAQMSRFLYRSPFLPKEASVEYHETSQLKFYREKLEEKASSMNSIVTSEAGKGAPINLNTKQALRNKEQRTVYKKEKEKESADNFLKTYRNDITALPKAGEKENYIQKLNIKEKTIFTTLLPMAAAIKKRNPSIAFNELISETKNKSVFEIDSLLH